MGFQELLQLIKEGEPLVPGVPNRPLTTLDQRTRYLYEVLRAAGIGSTIIARGVTVASACNVGQPVYWNANNQRFEQAFAVVSTDIVTGMLVTAPSAQVWGVIYEKSAADKADVLLSGYATLDITAALDTGETLKAGAYYLSRQTAGRLTSLKPPIAIALLKTSGDGKVFVNPQWTDLLADHTHLKFNLRPIPAGLVTPPSVGDVHVITDPDIDIEGWLPADHASFGGKAPYGARFGYNLAANPSLANAWPPLPPEDAVLLQDGVELDNGNAGQVILDRNGIWWLSNCYGEAPWPTDLTTTPEQLSAWSQSSGSDPCYDYRMRFELFFTKYGFLTDQTVVTSLTTNDTRIKIFCRGQPNTPAATGPLELALDLQFALGTDDEVGYLALKELDATTGKFNRGPVVRGAYSGSSNLTITSQYQTLEQILSLPAAKTTVHHGLLKLVVDTSFNRELFVQLVRLDGVEERYVEDVMYLALLQGAETEYRARIHVPETLDLVSPVMRLKFRLIGRVAGNLPPLTLTYRRVPAADTPEDLPTVDTSLTLTIAATLTDPNQYVDVVSASFAIEPGDDVLFTLSRADDDSYLGEVGVMRQLGILSAE